jgi:sirohydrochlorin ferrochelatase
VVLVAHGSRDPRAEAAVGELAAAVQALLSGLTVSVAYLDFTQPSVGEALRGLAADGHSAVVAVPLLFAPGYHVQVDLPAAIAEVRAGGTSLDVAVAAPLGSAPEPGEPDLLLDALDCRLAEAAGRIGSDGVVLASAGSSDPRARAAIEGIARRWAARRGGPVLTAYATSGDRTVAEAIEQLRDRGCRTVAVSGLFLAPGRLPEAVRRSAVAAGAVVAEPLRATPALVRLMASRALARPVSVTPELARLA